MDLPHKPGLQHYNWGAIVFALGMFFISAHEWNFIGPALSLIFHVLSYFTMGACFVLITIAYVKALKAVESTNP